MFWSLLGGSVTRILAFVASLCVARLLGGERFGELAIIRSTALMGSMFAAFGIGLTAAKHIAEYRDSNHERAGRVVVLSLIVSSLTGGLTAIVVWTLSGPMARSALHAPDLENLIALGGILLILNTMIIAQAGVLAGFEAFRALTRAGVVGGLISVPILIAATFILGLPGAVYGLIIGAMIDCVLNHRAVRAEARVHKVPLTFRSCFKEWKTLGAFSMPIALGNIVAAPVTWASHAMLASQLGGYTQMGIFNVANQWRLSVLFVPERIALTTVPILSTLTAFNRKNHFRRTLRHYLLSTVAIACALAAPIILLSPWIVTLYGSDFVSGAPALALLTASAILASVGLVLERTLAGLGRVWYRLTGILVWALTLMGGVLFFVVGGGGASELALANLIASAACTSILAGLVFVAIRNHEPGPENGDAT